jgi:cytochrome c6
VISKVSNFNDLHLVVGKSLVPILILFSFLSPFPKLKAQISNGQKIFESKCVKCHGIDGTKEKVGAKNLRFSKLSGVEILAMMEEGKKVMPAYKKKLSPEEIKNVAEYVKTLRK